MAAFNFPDPLTGETTVTNPITGSTYQWQDPPGKWVVIVKMRDIGDIIWEGDSPPDPIGDYKLWYSTDTLELYFYYTDSDGTSAWLPTSKPITLLEDLDKNLAAVQLEIAQTNQAVNENTNRIASIVYFGEEAPVIFADEDLGETDPVTGEPVLEPSDLNYKFWLNTTDNQLSILRIDGAAPSGYSYAEVSSTSDLQEVCDTGNVTTTGATFGGKVIVEPGTEGDEAVTYGQLATVEEELEQLAPSIERGSWTFTFNHPPGVGEYCMIESFLDEDAQENLCNVTYTKCISDAGGDASAATECNRAYNTCMNEVDGSKLITTNEWSKCDELVFNNVDANGVTHGWAGIDSDHYIDVFNATDASFMVGDISIHGGGSFQFDLVTSRGIANGLASIKIFKTQGSVDFDEYVRKGGDTMTGRLTIERPRDTSNANSFRIRGRVGGVETNLFKDYQRSADSPSSDYIEYFGTCGTDNAIANRKHILNFINQAKTPTPFTWTLEDSASGTSKGCIRFKDGKFIYLSQFTYEGIQLLNPTDMPTGAQMFTSYMPIQGGGISAAKTMQIWQQSSSGAWKLKAWMIPYKYRFWYGGWCQLEYKYAEGDMTPSYGSRYGLSLPELFQTVKQIQDFRNSKYGCHTTIRYKCALDY